jgi:hypothetical protein
LRLTHSRPVEVTQHFVCLISLKIKHLNATTLNFNYFIIHKKEFDCIWIILKIKKDGNKNITIVTVQSISQIEIISNCIFSGRYKNREIIKFLFQKGNHLIFYRQSSSLSNKVKYPAIRCNF